MDTLDIPQANDLGTVRRVVSAVRNGASTFGDVQERTGYSRRHVQYRVHAARILGWLRIEAEGALVLTAAGERLLETDEGTCDERAAFARAIEGSPQIAALAPTLLGPVPPFASDLAETIIAVTGMSPSTALRRAEGLLAWRRRVLDEVLPTAAVPDAAASAEPPRGQLSLPLG